MGLIVLFVSSLFLIPVIGFSFLPDAEENEMTMTYTANFEENRTDVEILAKKVEKEILSLEEIEKL